MNNLYIKACIALLFVIIAILVLSFILKYLKSLKFYNGFNSLSINEISIIDSKNKIVVIKRGGASYVLLLSNTNNILIETTHD